MFKFDFGRRYVRTINYEVYLLQGLLELLRVTATVTDTPVTYTTTVETARVFFASLTEDVRDKLLKKLRERYPDYMRQLEEAARSRGLLHYEHDLLWNWVTLYRSLFAGRLKAWECDLRAIEEFLMKAIPCLVDTLDDVALLLKKDTIPIYASPAIEEEGSEEV